MRRERWLMVGWAALAACAAALMLLGPAAANISSGQYCCLSKERICVNYNFSGDSVAVSGLAEPGAEVIVKVSSPPASLKLARKGKVGPIWMNVSEAEFRNAPAFYKVNCTQTLNPVLPSELLNRLGLGYDGLKSQITVSPAREDSPENFQEFTGLKESERLYEVKPRSVQVDSQGVFHTSFEWPSNAPAGPYTVTVYQVKDGRLLREATGRLSVETVGLTRWLADLAQHSPSPLSSGRVAST
jgi:uncharacterized protein (TIGR02186 family)